MSTRKIIRSFSIRPELWEQFMKLVRQEQASRPAESASQKIEEWIETYVRQHSPGNPQRPLTVYLGEPTPTLPPGKCPRCRHWVNGDMALHLQYCRGE